MLKKLITLSSLLFLSVVLVYGLYVKSQKALDQRSGFLRFIKTGIVGKRHEYDLKYNSYYIAGADAKNIYLGNVISNPNLLTIPYDFSEPENQTLSYDSGKVAWAALKLQVDSPMVYAYELITPTLLVKEINKTETKATKSNANKIYSINNINPNSFVAAIADRYSKKKLLTKFDNGKPGKRIELKDSGGDGIFSTDGQLLHVRDKIIYVFYYKNKFLIADSSLSQSKIFSTIDTINVNNVKVAEVFSTGMNTLTAPPTVVNKRVGANDKMLFIQSTRIADNEPRFTDRTTIDRYQLTDGKYLGSFYIPIPSKTITSIFFTNDKLIVVADKVLYWYDLRNWM